MHIFGISRSRLLAGSSRDLQLGPSFNSLPSGHVPHTPRWSYRRRLLSTQSIAASRPWATFGTRSSSSLGLYALSAQVSMQVAAMPFMTELTMQRLGDRLRSIEVGSMAVDLHSCPSRHASRATGLQSDGSLVSRHRRQIGVRSTVRLERVRVDSKARNQSEEGDMGKFSPVAGRADRESERGQIPRGHQGSSVW